MEKRKLSICFTCVGSKNGEVEIEMCYDCVVGPEDWLASNEKLPNKVKALDLYTGPGWAQVLRTIKNLREKFDLSVYIFSAGLGIVHEDDLTNPYSATFSSGNEDRIEAVDQKDWVLGVTQRRLPEGTVCVFPETYAKPYRRIWDDLDKMLLIQGTPDDREDLSCSMIRTSTTLMEKISETDIEPNEWPSIRGYDLWT